MPEVSNPTSRVIDVLNFLAAHPTEAFSLAEIARQVGLSNGSAHRVLNCLESANFLSRDDRRRSFSLGMAMVGIGQAAVDKHRGIEVTRRELARLAVELNLQCSANAVVDDELLVLANEGTAPSHRGLTRVGERHPLVPPLGLCHVAWGGDAAIAAYVGKAAAHLTDAAHRQLLASFHVIRHRGYTIGANGPGTSRSREAIVLAAGKVRDQAYWGAVYALVSELTPEEVQLFHLADIGADGVGHIAAPVFSPTGHVAFQLVLTGLPGNLAIADIEHCAERLCATARSITHETRGRQPRV